MGRDLVVEANGFQTLVVDGRIRSLPMASNYITCKICDLRIKGYSKMREHLLLGHGMSDEDYYNLYLNPLRGSFNKDYLTNEELPFKGLQYGYKKFKSRSNALIYDKIKLKGVESLIDTQNDRLIKFLEVHQNMSPSEFILYYSKKWKTRPIITSYSLGEFHKNCFRIPNVPIEIEVVHENYFDSSFNLQRYVKLTSEGISVILVEASEILEDVHKVIDKLIYLTMIPDIKSVVKGSYVLKTTNLSFSELEHMNQVISQLNLKVYYL